MTEPLPNAKADEGEQDAAAGRQGSARSGPRTDADEGRAAVAPGSTVSDTGVRGQGFGLSTGGGPGTGSTLDVQDFCCPDYIALMVERIRSAWQRNQGTPGADDRQVHDSTRRQPHQHGGRARQRHVHAGRGSAARGAADPHLAAVAGRVPESDIDRSSEFSIPMRQTLCTGVVALGLLAAWPHAQQTPASQTPASQTPQQPSDIGATISGDAGSAPRLAVPPIHRAQQRRRDRRGREDRSPRCSGTT